MRRPNVVDGLPDEVTAAKALSHSLRRKILDELHTNGPSSPVKLKPTIGASVPLINHHLKVLMAAGFVVLDEIAARRGAPEHFYRAVLNARLDVWATAADED